MARCPAWAREFQQHIRQAVADGAVPPGDPRAVFWRDLDIPAIHAAVRARYQGSGSSPRE